MQRFYTGVISMAKFLLMKISDPTNDIGVILTPEPFKPIILKSDRVSTYDCDDTLVRWIWDQNEKEVLKDKMLKFDTTGTGFHMRYVFLVPNEEVINNLKQNKATGGAIVVWSAGGYLWAEEVVKVLGLKDQVDLIMSKPTRYVDDLPCTEWMGKWRKVNTDGTINKENKNG